MPTCAMHHDCQIRGPDIYVVLGSFVILAHNLPEEERCSPERISVAIGDDRTLDRLDRPSMKIYSISSKALNLRR